MIEVVISPLAKQDIQEAAEWYSLKQFDLGLRFIDEIEDVINYTQQHPKLFAIRYAKTRCAVLNTFPYMIHYTFNHTKKVVFIAAVLHTSLNPNTWKSRQP